MLLHHAQALAHHLAVILVAPGLDQRFDGFLMKTGEDDIARRHAWFLEFPIAANLPMARYANADPLGAT